MSARKRIKEAVKTKVLLLLLDGIRYLMSIDKELHAINIMVIFRDKPDFAKVGRFKLFIKNRK